ncbi:hypothetical protein D3C81_2153960 [compost metagenome]
MAGGEKARGLARQLSERRPFQEQPVDARVLAMDVNDNACFLIKRAALAFIASALAPTMD